MKATINIDGDLTIIAESDIEAYALQQWFNAYVNNGPNSLGIKVDDHKVTEDKCETK